MLSRLTRAVCLLIFSVLSFYYSSAQLREIYHSEEYNNHLRSISFYSPSEGYVAFWNWVGYTADSGRTYAKKYITDANIDWNGYPEWNDVGFWIHGVKAISRDTILVYGQLDDHASILYSVNGGNNFKLIFYSWYTAYIKNYVSDMSFAPNSNVGYAVDNDRILKTTNRGVSWSIAGSDPEPYNDFHSVQAISNNEVIAISQNDIYRSVNGAAPFTKLNIPQGWLRHGYFITGNKGWAAIDDNVYYTSDGGDTWTKKNKISHTFTRLHFVNDSTGYGIVENNTVFKTTDSGKVWEPLVRVNPLNASWNHTNLFFWSNNQFWAGGDGGFLELTTNAGGIPVPQAYFRIDTTGVHTTNTVNLFSLSKPTHQHKWYKNDTLIGTGYNASYAHYLYEAVDTIKLVVINGSLTDTVIQYQYFNAPPRPAFPSITGFTPVTGPTGTIVTISGHNFTGTTSVSFGGVPATSFTVVSANIIKAVVGNGATGDVVVTTPIGVATRPGYTWFIPFAITSFSPASGPVGTQVTINGNHFNATPASNIVYFGAVKATVVSATSTQLVVTVPVGATYEPISVTTNNLTAYSRLPFLLTFAGGGPITANSFPFKVDSSCDTHSYFFHTNDLDGDGRPDLIMANYEGPGRLTISRNTSTLNNVSFAPKQYLELAASFYGAPGLATGDINGDGMKDIVATNPDNTISIFRNTSTPGTLSFAAKADISITYIYDPTFLGVADFEGDGKPDIYAIEGGRIAIYKNNSSGNNIQFSLSPTSLYSGSFGDCQVMDIDGDGKPDMVSHHGGDFVRVYRNTSNGGIISFASPMLLPMEDSYIGRLALGDLDNDGKPELVVKDNNQFIAVFPNTSVPGQVSFGTRKDFPQTTYAPQIAIADMNGDGKADIVLANDEAYFFETEDIQASILENTSTPGNLSFAPRVELAIEPLNQNTHSTAVVDIDGDGKNDVVTLNAGQMDFSVFLNQQGIGQVKICDMGSTTLTSNLTGATYQWQRNVSGTFVNISNNSNFSGANTKDLQLSNIPASWNGYQYRCLVNGNPSQVFRVAIDTFSRPEVTIATVNTAVCAGSPVTFTATPSKAGKTPHYEWQVNGAVVGTDTSVLTINTLNDNDQIRVIITGSLQCHAPAKDTSNVLTMDVHNLTVTPKVRIEASDTTICQGEKVTFRAIPENGGFDPQFHWRYLILPAPGSTDSSLYTTPELTSSGSFYLFMVSNAACADPVEVMSNSIFIEVEPRQYPTIRIEATADRICTGTPVTFTATTTYEGPNPQYLWKHNAAEVGTGKTYTTSNFATGDKIFVNLVSSYDCIVTPYTFSNTITMEVNNPFTPTIGVSGNTVVNPGQFTTLTATFNNGSATPGLQWQDSTATHTWANIAGATSNTLVYTPSATGVKVRCVLTSNAACASVNTVNSAALVMTVNAPTGVNPVPADNYGIRFSPNPVNSYFTIDKLRLSDQWESLEIISAEGRQRVISKSIRNQTMVNVYVHNLRNGFYVAVLRRRNGEAVYTKFVKL
jgi:hypothetical protein